MYTTLWGGWHGGGAKGRFVVDIEDLGEVTRDTTGVWVRSRWYLEFNQATWDTSNSFDPNGSFEEAPRQVTIGSSRNPVTRAHIFSKDIFVNLQFGSPTSIHVAGTISGLTNVGTTIGIDQWFSLPARLYYPPDPATGVTAVKNSETQATVSWVPHYTSAGGPKPWHDQVIDRTTNGSWGQFVNASGFLGWQPTNWVDTGLQPNSRYDYRHVAFNSAGISGHAYASATIYTKAAAPSAVVAEKQPSGSIRVSTTNQAPWVVAFEVQDTTDGVNWSTLTTSAWLTWDHANPSTSVTHRYRVRAKTPDGAWSDWSPASNIVQLLAPPIAPTWRDIAPAFDATSPIETPWDHNPVDTTPQRRYQAQYRQSADNGATWSAWTSPGIIDSATSSRTWSGGTFQQNRLVEIQVRTWGAHADPSPYSTTTLSFRTSARPLVGITNPPAGTTLRGKTLTLGWAYSDPEGTPQSAFRVGLYLGADLKGQWSESGPASTYVVPADLADDKTYRATVEARDGHGLWSAVSETFIPVDYSPPEPPNVSASWDTSRGSAVLFIVNPASTGGTPPAVYNNVYRDGVLIARNVPLSSTFTDPLPLPSGSTYTVEAVSALPSVAPTSVFLAPVEDVLRRVWLNSGPDWGVIASFWGNLKRGQTQGRQRFVEQYAGRSLEVETIGEGRVSRLRASGTLILTEDSPQDFFAVANEPTAVCYRDRYGSWFVSIQPIDSDAENDALASVSLQMTETDFKDRVR